MTKKNLLLLTDFFYEAKGREYYKEDLELWGFLRKHFNVFVSHIEDCESLLHQADVILLRNTGPQALHQEALTKLQQVKELPFFNDLKGKGDLDGKQHLLDLYREGFPVIPSFEYIREINKAYDQYLLKPLDGADSIGVKIVGHDQLQKENLQRYLIQPVMSFDHEVSFYFINDKCQYAFKSANKDRRWELELFEPNPEDLRFAKKFIEWNSCKRGIQRVDAARLHDGSLLLMELEDYNPFLSLDRLPLDVRHQVFNQLVKVLMQLV